MQIESANGYGWLTAVLATSVIVGATAFWLLSQGMLGQGAASILIPVSFLGAAAAIVTIAVRHQRP